MSRPDHSPGYQRLRAGRHSQPNRAYLLTTVAHDRARLFADWPAGSLMSRLLSDTGLWQGARLHCWVLMPDHWHGLVTLDGSRKLAVVVKRVKGTSARHFNRTLERLGTVWRDGFHDRAIRRDEDMRTVARYIVANPLRAGLVDRVGDYPFWDAEWLRHSGEEFI